MEVLEAIRTRRSIRRFLPQPVPPEMVEQLLRAGMQAPSAHNAQPWQFIVITDRSQLDAIPKFHPYAEMLKEAPMAILVCGDERLTKAAGSWVLDCSAATQNILLAAHGLGLGAVWVSVYGAPPREEGMRQLTSLPPEVHPHSLIPIGYAFEPVLPTDRFKPARIHTNHWE
ncbi:MAG: nitroreductase family protein [Anaerolineaceae bacterium]|nr:nitroreductase family protein [Anaerolineaceae bacterium]